jgi:predicted Fe-Mo cluster-binding NifX family protein
MKVCFPVQHVEGIESRVFNHFGSAPFFVVVDTSTSEVSTITNRDEHHAHGACNPVLALDNQSIDAVVVGGIGGGALNRLNQAGIRVYRTAAENVKENVALYLAKGLQEFGAMHVCGGHSHGGGCSH